MKVFITGEFSTQIKFRMLSFFILLYVTTGVQGKAFPGEDYEANYHYIPVEGIVKFPSRYTPENFPNHHDYVPGYVQATEHDWSAYYHQPMVPHPLQDVYSDINEHHNMKAKRTWHFIDQNHAPITKYIGESHLESNAKVPKVNEVPAGKEVIDGHDTEYDDPIAIEAFVKTSHMDQENSEIPANIDFLTIKKKPIKHDYNGKPIVIASTIKHPNNKEYKNNFLHSDLLTQKPFVTYDPVSDYDAFELSIVGDPLGKKDEPIKVELSTPYDTHEPIKERHIKEKPIKPIKEKPIKDFPYNSSIQIEQTIVVDSPDKDKTIKVEPAVSYMYKPVKEKPIKNDVVFHDAPDYPNGVDFLYKGKESGYETPLVVEALIRKEKPTFHTEEEFEMPVIVEESVRKEKPSIHTEEEFEMPVIVEALVRKEKPAIHTEEEFEMPVIVEESVRKEKPAIHTEEEFEMPVIVEALVRKEKPAIHTEEEFEMPVIVEAFVPEIPVHENTNTITKDKLPQNLLHPIKESILIEDESFDVPVVVEVLTFEQDADRNETSKQKGIFDETHGFREPDIDNLDENEDNGSAMDFDRSRLARSFLPINSNVFSTVVNFKEREKPKFKNCVTPKNETGNCMPIQLCSISSTMSNIDELLRNVCLMDEVFIGVCCPEFPVETVRVDWGQLKPNKELLNEKSQISKECGMLSPMVTDQDPWPWMASLIAKSSDKIFCGGALINEQHVLTAAHCTIRIPRNQILVRLGRPALDPPEPDFEVIEIKRHAGYNPKTMQNDIALLKLSRRVQLGDFRRVVCLAKENTEGLVNESASLLRWKETPGEIKDVETLLAISSRECQSRMQTPISDSILCTEPRTDETMCNADSGAPLIISKDGKFEVIGILTWNRNDCDERFPTVFTRVSTYHRWIEKLAS